ncbi:hypothetical protein FACS18942_02560 [Planctomycetales bacterium]|nr:hypothetical protein FACS18942_02560 [Planctomycetales bacterium]GHT36079.1 hypothetical protein FACS189427_06990 [Planctomycetales bacterium]
MSGLSLGSISSSGLAAQHQVQRTYSRLSDTLTQLSTGSRINSAKDDPAGLIAQELLKSDIAGTNAAVKNSQLANSMLKVAESGMRQINSLLTEAKALAVESANTGAMSPEMIAANQMQMDTLMESVNRISSMTNWLGTPLLDGHFSSENGGATFQLGPDVVDSQQLNVPLESTRTTNVGNTSGTLADLISGGAATLAANPGLADSIINSAVLQIASQRGQIGTVQKYALDTNVSVLQDTLVQLHGALSLISDTDFAVAASNLTRDQILLQSGLKTLGITNQQPKYAASLLS